MGKGRLKMPEDLRGLKRMNQRDVELLFNKFMDKSARELVAFTKDLSNTTKEVIVARILVEAIRHGDQNKLEFILNRLIGKPKEVIEMTHKVNYHSQIMDIIDDLEKDVTPLKQIEYNHDEE